MSVFGRTNSIFRKGCLCPFRNDFCLFPTWQGKVPQEQEREKATATLEKKKLNPTFSTFTITVEYFNTRILLQSIFVQVYQLHLISHCIWQRLALDQRSCANAKRWEALLLGDDAKLHFFSHCLWQDELCKCKAAIKGFVRNKSNQDSWDELAFKMKGWYCQLWVNH